MSAASFGDELLGGVKEETLKDLLQSLREAQSISKSKTGVSAIENILDAFQNPPSTRNQEYLRTHGVTQPQSTQPAREKPPAVIEITGTSACSGKTQLLYYIVTRTLLPAFYQEKHLNGNGQAVVLLDLSGRFSILRLRDVMRAHISRKFQDSSSDLTDGQIASLTSDSLTHLHVFKPQSTPSLLATLASLPSYLLFQPSTHFSASRALGLLAINDLSAFLCQDRLDAEDDPTERSTTHTTEQASNNNNTTNPLIDRYRQLTTHLRNLHALFSTLILVTNHSLTPPTSTTGHPALRPHLPAIWNNFRTVSIAIERDRVSKFGPGTSAEEAKGEQTQRWEAVRKSGFCGWVNWWGSEAWRAETREAVNALARGGRFAFWVRDGGGIVFEEDGV